MEPRVEPHLLELHVRTCYDHMCIQLGLKQQLFYIHPIYIYYVYACKVWLDWVNTHTFTCMYTCICTVVVPYLHVHVHVYMYCMYMYMCICTLANLLVLQDAFWGVFPYEYTCTVNSVRCLSVLGNMSVSTAGMCCDVWYACLCITDNCSYCSLKLLLQRKHSSVYVHVHA